MEYNFVFLGNRDRNEVIENISSNLRLIPSSYQVVFLNNAKPTDKINQTKINYKTIVFNSSAKNEEMFETYLQNQGKSSIILFNENAININWNDILKMIEIHANGNMLVVSKQKKEENFFKKAFYYTKNFFAKVFLGIKLFESDAEIILLDKLLISTMKEMPGRSATLTRINGWAGIEPNYVEIDEQPNQNQKAKYKAKDFASVIISSAVFLLFIIADIVLGIMNISFPFILLFLYIVLQVGTIALLIYFLTSTLFKLKYGNLKYVGKVKIIEEIDKFEE